MKLWQFLALVGAGLALVYALLAGGHGGGTPGAQAAAVAKGTLHGISLIDHWASIAEYCAWGLVALIALLFFAYRTNFLPRDWVKTKILEPSRKGALFISEISAPPRSAKEAESEAYIEYLEGRLSGGISRHIDGVAGKSPTVGQKSRDGGEN